MKFKSLVDYLEKLEKISSRLEMNSILKELFQDLSKESEPIIKESVYMLLGRLGPEYVSIKFNVSDKTIKKVLVELFGEKETTEANAKYGDLGEVFKILSSRAEGSLDVSAIYKKFLEIAHASGSGSSQRKQDLIKEALKNLLPEEGKYFIRIILEELRVGFSEKTFTESLSVYAVSDKSLRSEMERAYGVNPDMGELVYKVIKEGEKGLDEIKVFPSIPVKVKLVQREAVLEDILERINPVILQPKYDGIRSQIHIAKDLSKAKRNVVWQSTEDSNNKAQRSMFEADTPDTDQRVLLYTRNLENITSMFPDITSIFEKLTEKYSSLIFDAEIISRDSDSGRFQAFQETMKRKRKYEIAEKVAEIPVEVFIFDILYKDGEDLTRVPLAQRIEILKSVAKDFDSKKINVAETLVVTQEKELEETFQRYIKEGLEGLIAKDPESIYKVGTRNYDWIKFKRASRKELADSVDVVVMGYYAGRGRQVKFGMGAFLVGIYDKETDKVLTLAKVGTGVTDEQWGTIYKRLSDLGVDQAPPNYDIKKGLVPDFYVKPEVVAVIEADEITVSPIHSSGYALRFPRLKVFDRVDKKWTDTTSKEEIKELHKLFLSQLKGE
jgi:DNA ligase 1